MVKRFLYGCILILVAAIWGSSLSSGAGAAILMVDNFDDGAKPNCLGGDSGSWVIDPNDPHQFCFDSFESYVRVGERGYSLKLVYDVDSPRPAANGFWTKLERSDLSGYDRLVFQVKGDKEEGFTTRFKVELKNDRNEVGSYLVTGVTDSWQKIIIPFAEFRGITDWKRMTELVIVFDGRRVDEREGVIYLDNIYFSDGELLRTRPEKP